MKHKTFIFETGNTIECDGSLVLRDWCGYAVRVCEKCGASLNLGQIPYTKTGRKKIHFAKCPSITLRKMGA